MRRVAATLATCIALTLSGSAHCSAKSGGEECVSLPVELSLDRSSAEGEAYFSSPELGSRTHLAFWDDSRVRPACRSARQYEHNWYAALFGRLLAQLQEPDLRLHDGRFVRVVIVGDLTVQRDIYNIHFDDDRATLRTTSREWDPPSRPFSELSETEATAAFGPDRFSWVRNERSLSRTQAQRIWTLQRDVQPHRNGYFGWSDGAWMLVETMNHGNRHARVVLMGSTPGPDHLQCALAAMSGLQPESTLCRQLVTRGQQ